LREHFLERVFAFRRVKALLSASPQPRDLMSFHARHKLQLMAHAPSRVPVLGRLANGTDGSPADRAVAYADGFLDALASPSTRPRHVNVLQHMLGYFRDRLDAGSRRDLATSIAEFGQGIAPLVVPLALLAHHARREGLGYLLDQVYLQPHPKALKLRAASG
jgi:uncharacterized protein YbgA (DUF1722 family)